MSVFCLGESLQQQIGFSCSGTVYRQKAVSAAGAAPCALSGRCLWKFAKVPHWQNIEFAAF